MLITAISNEIKNDTDFTITMTSSILKYEVVISNRSSFKIVILNSGNLKTDTLLKAGSILFCVITTWVQFQINSSLSPSPFYNSKSLTSRIRPSIHARTYGLQRFSLKATCLNPLITLVITSVLVTLVIKLAFYVNLYGSSFRILA